jgi:hypothetical protein
MSASTWNVSCLWKAGSTAFVLWKFYRTFAVHGIRVRLSPCRKVLEQVCQMVYLHTKNTNFSIFWNRKYWYFYDKFVYFMLIWCILWQFGLFYDTFGIFHDNFGIFQDNLVYFDDNLVYLMDIWSIIHMTIWYILWLFWYILWQFGYILWPSVYYMKIWYFWYIFTIFVCYT